MGSEAGKVDKQHHLLAIAHVDPAAVDAVSIQHAGNCSFPGLVIEKEQWCVLFILVREVKNFEPMTIHTDLQASSKICPFSGFTSSLRRALVTSHVPFEMRLTL